MSSGLGGNPRLAQRIAVAQHQRQRQGRGNGAIDGAEAGDPLVVGAQLDRPRAEAAGVAPRGVVAAEVHGAGARELEPGPRLAHEVLEVVVCDDGSSDDSGDVIEAYARRDPRVRLYRKDNGGAASALNVAFSHSRGDIVCLLDADDIFERDKVARVVEAMRIQRCGVLVHPLLVIDGDGAVIQRKPAFGGFQSGWIGDRVARAGGAGRTWRRARCACGVRSRR